MEFLGGGLRHPTMKTTWGPNGLSEKMVNESMFDLQQ